MAEVNVPVKLPTVTELKTSEVGCAVGATQGGGGAQVKVNPEAGNIELFINALEVFEVPAVFAAHEPVLVTALFRKSLVEDPRIPTWPVIDVEVLLAVQVP